MPSTTPSSGQRHKLAWDVIRHGQQTKGVGLTPVTVSFLGAANSFDRPLFSSGSYALTGEWRVVGARITSDTTVAAGAAGNNYWVFQIRNVGTAGAGTDDLSASGLSTITVAVTENTPTVIPIEGPGNSTPTNVYMGENESLYLNAVETGAGTDLSTANITVTLFLLNSPPGRSAFQA